MRKQISSPRNPLEFYSENITQKICIRKTPDAINYCQPGSFLCCSSNKSIVPLFRRMRRSRVRYQDLLYASLHLI